MATQISKDAKEMFAQQVVPIGLDADEEKLWKWVRKACADDDTRPSLTGIQIRNGCLSAADGFVIFSVPLPDTLKDWEDCVLFPVGQAKSGGQRAQLVEVARGWNPPDTSLISMRAEEQVCTFFINPQLLASAMTGIQTQGALVRVYRVPDGKPGECMLGIESLTGEQKAILMGMRPGKREIAPVDFCAVPPASDRTPYREARRDARKDRQEGADFLEVQSRFFYMGEHPARNQVESEPFNQNVWIAQVLGEIESQFEVLKLNAALAAIPDPVEADHGS